MYKNSIFRLMVIILIFSGHVLSTQGCTYLKHRADDFKEILDIGITVSKKPYFALFADELSILPVGYAHVDGHFIGWGGGQLGKTPHAVHAWGALVSGSEELGWHRKYEGEGGEKEAEANEAWSKRKEFIEQTAGITMYIDGTLRFLRNDMFEGQNQPDHSLSCLHYIHLGWFVIVVNVRTLDILDFLLGWFGIDFGRLDLGGDDGTERRWGLKPGGWHF